MVLVMGIGWITGREFGCIARGERSRFEDDGHGRKGLFTHPFKNFGRLDRISRMTASAVALALRDAGIPYSPERKLDIGIVGTNGSGSLATDLLYFKDYVESGRTLGRGNLFIYTLPSSPLGEAAIHFGLQGPLLYAADGKASLGMVLETAEEMVLLGEAEAMLAGTADGQEALYFVLAKDKKDRECALCDFREARLIADKGLSVVDTIQEFRAVKGKKARS
jgi:3-oxoacyl-[acyl-carrier-protein] synthase II